MNLFLIRMSMWQHTINIVNTQVYMTCLIIKSKPANLSHQEIDYNPSLFIIYMHSPVTSAVYVHIKHVHIYCAACHSPETALTTRFNIFIA